MTEPRASDTLPLEPEASPGAREPGVASEDVIDALTGTGAEEGAAVAVVHVDPEAPADVEVPAVPDRPHLAFLEDRPRPGTPREYHFPPFQRDRLPNGLTLISAHLAGRPLLTAQLLLGSGAATEPDGQAGATVLMARALSEGTARRDAVALIEAAERLGTELHAEASWESTGCGLEVPRSRVGPALALLAEMVLEPSFPERDVDRLRDERENDLLQVRADPRRRAERVFPETIYASDASYRRPLAGTEATVPGLDRSAVAGRHGAILDPARATLVVAGDVANLPLRDLVEEPFGTWNGPAVASAEAALPVDVPHPDGPRIVLVDRPGAPQAELRIGHVGLSRRIPDFHAVGVLNAILGGLFNSRLQRLLREDRGYTYGVHSGFEMRLGRGPFAVRTAVQTDVTVPAIEAILRELRRIREAPVEARELDEARDYLIGVFPLRFEAPGQVVAALSGLIVFGLPDDELDRYRPSVASVTAEDVLAAARRHVRPEDASVVVVGDAARIEPELRAAGFGELTVVGAEG